MALPLSVIPTFAVMYLLGFTLNVVTLLALSLVVGILVDDAIVEIENIMRHLRMGKTPFQAAMEAADEIGLAVIATTFTLIAVFLPTAFMSGMPGKFFVQFGWTAAIAVFFSLVVARMLTPMMAAYLLKRAQAASETAKPRWLAIYLRWARWCLRHRIADDCSARDAVLRRLVRAGAAAAHRLHPARRPVADAGHARRCRRAAPSSRPAPRPSRRARSCRRTEHVKLVYTAIGGGSAGADPFAPQRRGRGAQGDADDQHDARATERRGVSKQDDREPAARARWRSCPARASRSASAASARSTCWCWPARTARRSPTHARAGRARPAHHPRHRHVTSTASLVRPELIVRPDFARAADLGVTSAAIADTLRIATAGDYDQGAGQAQPAASARCRSSSSCAADARAATSACSSRLPVPGARGPVLLAQRGDARRSAAARREIDRYDRLRNINFEIELNRQPLGEVEQQRDRAAAACKNLPPGVIADRRSATPRRWASCSRASAWRC